MGQTVNKRTFLGTELGALMGKTWKLKADEEFVVGREVHKTLTGEDLPVMYWMGLQVHTRAWIPAEKYCFILNADFA